VTALLEYVNPFAQFLLAVLDAVFLLELAVILQDNVGILSNYSRRSSYYSGIIPDSFNHLLFQKLFWHIKRTHA